MARVKVQFRCSETTRAKLKVMAAMSHMTLQDFIEDTFVKMVKDTDIVLVDNSNPKESEE